jgi:hypothetical protein
MATIGSRVNNVVRLQMPDENVTPLYHLVHGWMFELFQRQRGPMKRVEEVDKLLEPRFWNLRDLAQLVLCFEDLDDLAVHVENAAQAAPPRVPLRCVSCLSVWLSRHCRFVRLNHSTNILGASII